MQKARFIFLIVLCLLLARPAFAQTESVKIRLWHGWRGADADLLSAWIADYGKANPATVIDARFVDGDLRAQYEAALRTESGPDIVIGPASWVGVLAENKRVAPLDSRIDKDLRAQATDVSWQNLTVNGGTYGVPEGNSGLALFYNASLAEPPKTLDDLFAKPGQALLSYDFYTTAGIYLGMGGRLFSDVGVNLVNTDPTFSDYLTLLKQNYAAYRKDSPSSDRIPVVSDDAFRQGNAAFLIDGSWKITDLRYYLGDKLKVASLPTLKNGKPWTPFVATQAFYINANATNPDGAMNFIRYTLSTEAQTKAAAMARHVPVNPQAQIDDPLLAAFAKQFEAGAPVPTRPEMNVYWQPLDQAVFAVTVQGKAVDQAVLAATTQLQAALNPSKTPATAKP